MPYAIIEQFNSKTPDKSAKNFGGGWVHVQSLKYLPDDSSCYCSEPDFDFSSAPILKVFFDG